MRRTTPAVPPLSITVADARAGRREAARWHRSTYLALPRSRRPANMEPPAHVMDAFEDQLARNRKARMVCGGRELHVRLRDGKGQSTTA